MYINTNGELKYDGKLFVGELDVEVEQSPEKKLTARFHSIARVLQ